MGLFVRDNKEITAKVIIGLLMRSLVISVRQYNIYFLLYNITAI